MLSIDNIWAAIKPRILGMLGVPTAYTPVWTAATANPAIGNGTITGRYVLKPGKQCRAWVEVVMGSTTTFGTGAWSISLPFMANSSAKICFGIAILSDYGTANHVYTVFLMPGKQVLDLFIPMDVAGLIATVTPTSPFTWAANDVLRAQIDYEVE